MAKRRSIEEFQRTYADLVSRGKVREFEMFLDKYKLPAEEKRAVMERFKRDAEMVLRSSGHFPK
jgi:hypothetical protein